MSERLTYRNSPNGEAYLKYGAEAKWRKMPRFDLIKNAMQKLAEYEDLEEKGLLLRLPCKPGKKVWCIENFGCDGTLLNPPRIRETKFNYHLLEFVGKTVFLTQSEAEEKLREMEAEK